MDPSRSVGEWERITQLFDETLPLGAAARTARLATEPPEIRTQVESLLDALEREGGRFAGTAFDLLHEETVTDLLAEARPGMRIGPYEVVREVGRGGMGAVYEGRRVDSDFHKRVAIKLVALGARTERVMRRFRRERRILASLEHPNIATLLDGGVTADGVPFFALEFVEGVPIHTFAAQRALPVHARLRLVRQVCEALDYAHRQLVVHRDLKPANILVGPDGVVRLLDFGVAKVLEDSADGGDDRTQGEVLPYTPAYASPEQLLGDPVSTACDIHGLGLVLYEVLTGRHPFRAAGDTGLEVRRRLLEDAPPPSGLGRDIDAILARALAKAPSARYTSTAALADDLDRFIAGHPLAARPVTRRERISKFVARHRAAVVATALAGLALIGGVATTVWQARRTSAQRARAEAFAGFVREMLTAPDPSQEGREARVLDLLGNTVARLRAGEVADAATRADIERTLGTTYTTLGVYDTAEVLLRVAVQRSTDALGPSDPETARSQLALARLEAAVGRSAAAESLFRAGITILRAHRGTEDGALAGALSDLGNLLFNVGRLQEAEPVLLEALAIGSAAGVRPLDMVNTHNTLGLVREHQGDAVGARARYRQAIMSATPWSSAARASLVAPLANLANTLKLEDSLAAADSLQLVAVTHAQAAFGDRHVTYGAVLTGLADIRRRRGNFDAAERDLREAVRVLAAALPPDHLQQAPTLSLLGLLLCERAKAAEGTPLLERALDIRRRQLPAGHWFIHNLESGTAVCYRALGRHADARAIARSGFEGLSKALGPSHPRTLEARDRLRAVGGDPTAR